MSYLSYSKDYQGVAEVFLRDPDRYTPLLQFIEAVMTGESGSHQSRTGNDCHSCFEAQRLRFLPRRPQMDSGRRGYQPSSDWGRRGRDQMPQVSTIGSAQFFALPPNSRQTPEAVGQSDVDALLATPAGPINPSRTSINVIALFNYVNRLVDAFGIKGNEAYFKQVGAAIANQGYAPLINRALKKAS